MRLLMLSGDRQVALGEKGPFYAMQAEFSRHFERIDVLCPRPPGPVKRSAIHERVFLHPAPCGRIGMRSYLVKRGAELVAEHRHALIVSHDYGWFYNGLAAAELSRRARVPYVSEIHHVPGVPLAADMRERFDRAVARAYIRWARGRARAFRVVNRVEMPALLQRWGVRAEQIAVLPSLYIDLDVFRPARVPTAPQQDVLFVGRMVRNKGLDTIADALAILKRRGLPHSALFVGRGPLRERLRARLAAAGLSPDARFVEWVEGPSDLAEVYRRSRAVVCASTCEGGPRVTVEGMACGTPAVSTRVGVMGEILRTGENGALVDFDARSLADGLALVLENEERRRAMGAAAIETAARFEQRAMIQNYAEGLQRLAG